MLYNICKVKSGFSSIYIKLSPVSALARKGPYVITICFAVKQPNAEPHVCIFPSSPAMHFDLCGHFSLAQAPKKIPQGMNDCTLVGKKGKQNTCFNATQWARAVNLLPLPCFSNKLMKLHCTICE